MPLGCRKDAAELVALAPDVILANASPATAALKEATRTLPIVFVKRHRSSRCWLGCELGALTELAGGAQ
jgi:hypothetical protein